MGLVAQLQRERAIKLVTFNESHLITFGNSDRIAVGSVGSKGLSACSVVALVGNGGVIVARFGRDMPGMNSPIHFHMGFLIWQYYANWSAFGAGSKIYTIFATNEGDVLAQRHKLVIGGWLTLWGMSPVEHHYDQNSSAMINEKSAKGTFLVDVRHDPPKVYLEDREITAQP